MLAVASLAITAHNHTPRLKLICPPDLFQAHGQGLGGSHGRKAQLRNKAEDMNDPDFRRGRCVCVCVRARAPARGFLWGEEGGEACVRLGGCRRGQVILCSGFAIVRRSSSQHAGVCNWE
jgi:hypothetical protein